MRYEPRHPITVPAKVDALVASMASDGWVGAPLVKWGEIELLTGTHRYAAASRLGIEVPVIDLEDVFAEAGLDLGEEHDALVDSGSAEAGWDGIEQLVSRLPAAVREGYGIE